MAVLSSSQCSGSSVGASAAGRDCQPYSSNDFESFDSESEISSSRAPGLLVVGGELWRSATLEWRPMPTTADHRGHIPAYIPIFWGLGARGGRKL